MNRLTISIQVLADHLLPVIIQLIYGFSHVLPVEHQLNRDGEEVLVLDGVQQLPPTAEDGGVFYVARHVLREGEV